MPGVRGVACRSSFTFVQGASLPEKLVARAAEKRYSSLALTDEATLSGVVRAHIEARERGIHFIVGSELQLTTAGGAPFARLVLLAQDRRRYGTLAMGGYEIAVKLSPASFRTNSATRCAISMTRGEGRTSGWTTRQISRFEVDAASVTSTKPSSARARKLGIIASPILTRHARCICEIVASHDERPFTG
ncbi:PHP domain-containing protein [Variovorax sp. J22G73]|uniref:PHP domain-containing protein n=1 Tax=unclassified Variovorax TaxID=663243 RepID=UPI0025778793|nr:MULTISPECIES: PHP domain-containing protein [unclassified Variovorax]MDM0007459.1 PHP domain-containing protein [Variovorax sp. J22R203]MDM0100182.1 PHP domain-containing protein [Variovorax sp. J22G73]